MIVGIGSDLWRRMVSEQPSFFLTFSNPLACCSDLRLVMVGLKR